MGDEGKKGKKGRKKAQRRWMEFLTMMVTALLFSIVVGVIMTNNMGEYVVPGINLHILTFVSMVGLTAIGFLAKWMVNGK